VTTSGTITTTDTVRDIAKDALIELEVIGANEEPSAEDMALCVRRLNWMLKDWQNDGVNLWRQSEVDITWPAETAEGDVSPSINDILELRYIGDYERQLTRWELADYASLPNKTSPGLPSIFCVTEGLSGARLRLWPVPASESALRATVSRVIEDVTNANETIDVPQKYTRTVMMNLAANVSSAFGRAGTPAGMRADAEAARLYRIMRAADRPASYTFETSLGA
jgi:hypothetical protein